MANTKIEKQKKINVFLIDFPEASLKLILNKQIPLPKPMHIIGGLSGGIGDAFVDHGFFDANKVRIGNYSDFHSSRAVPVALYEDLADFRVRFTNWIHVENEKAKDWCSISEHYFRCIEVAYSILTKNRIDLIVCASWPHIDLQNAIFAVSRLIGIQSLFLNANYLFDRRTLSFGDNPFDLGEKIDGWETVDPSPITSRHISYLAGDAIERPWWIQDYERELALQDHTWLLWLKKLFRDFLGIRLFQFSGLPIKIRAGSFASKKSWPNNLEANNLLLRLHYRNHKNRKHYDKICCNSEPQKDEVCFFAPFQPEAISNLYAGQFERIETVLEVLFENLPDNMVVRFREHPSTFLGSSKGAFARSPQFYERLGRKFPRLKFQKRSVKIKHNIDNCAAVVTIGGSVGYEALARGVPVILFGTVWYSKFSGVYHGTELTPRTWEVIQSTPINRDHLEKQASRVLSNSCDNLLRTADPEFSSANNLCNLFRFLDETVLKHHAENKAM